ncbi:methyl-accepting chemotaxis protein [Anoxynatronum buryatiense]|uniref:Methyl-accepting chemotaxis protein n=1 Tax=Anoxynatronum buryatiense TaxID=489973 RepID=A0AA46AJI3_9CLOT|nr:methyl-accepting chemotaxis protein [Anoxynatronum buryatiense]SMP61815.1 methyl-accepting chemotaxis protein [Anoxynatronum buryatiense]
MGSGIKVNQKRGSLKGRVFWLLTAILVLLNAAVVMAVVDTYRKNLTEQLMSEQLGILRATAVQINGDAFQEMVQMASAQHSYYEPLRRYLEQVKIATGLQYLYTEAFLTDGTLVYIVDGGDPASDDFSAFGDEVEPDEIEDAQLVFSGQEVMIEIYETEEWGALVTSKIPVFNEAGQVVGVLGGDYPASLVGEMVAGIRMRMIFIMSILSLLGIAILMLGTSKLMLTPLKQLENQASYIGRGDFSVDVAPSLLKRKDEIGSLALVLQQTIDVFRQLIAGIVTSSQRVAAASEQLTATTGQSAEASQNVAGSATHVAVSADSQMKSILAVTQEISHITQGMEQVAQHIGGIESLSHSVRGESEKGQQEMNRVSLQMQEIQTSHHQVKGGLIQITESSRKMNEIIGVIRSIAEQTNLLALNAAIEAARAGEQGKGFAVVADEVRKLAEESQQATEEINHLIMDNDNNISRANEVMETGTLQVASGMEVVQDAEAAFKSIVTLIQQMNEAVGEVNEVTGQVTSGSRNVSQAAEIIRKSAESVASEVQNVSAAAQQQTASMQEIASSSHELAVLAQELQTAVGQFRLT